MATRRAASMRSPKSTALAPVRRSTKSDLLEQKTAPAERDFERSESYLTHAYEPQIPPDIGQWNIETVRAARDLHMMGDFLGSGLLAEIVLTDPRIIAAVLRRVGPALGIPRQVDPPTRWRGKGVSEEIRANTQELFGETSLACSPGVIAHCVWAMAAMGFVVVQVVWHVEDGMLWPELRPWPVSMQRFNRALRRYQLVTTEGLLTIEPGDGKWLVVEPFGPRSWMFGLMRSNSLLWADRAYTLRDRSNHSAAHGSLSPVATMGEGVKINSKEGQAMRTAVRNLQNPRSGIVIPFGATIKPFEPQTMAWQIFGQVISSDNEDIDLAWCGISSSGVYKSISQIDGVAFDRVRMDVSCLAAVFTHGVVEPFVELNYGEDPTLVPTLRWKVPDPREEVRVKALAARHQGFAKTVQAYRAAGLLVDEAMLTELALRFDVPVPELAPEPEPAAAPSGAPNAPPGAKPGAAPPAEGDISVDPPTDAADQEGKAEDDAD